MSQIRRSSILPLVITLTSGLGIVLILLGLFNSSPTPRAEVNSSSEDHAAFIVYLDEQADLSPALQIEDWEARGWFVLNTLRATADRTQPPVVETLQTLQERGHVSAYHPHYVGNLIVVFGDGHAAQVITNLQQVSLVDHGSPTQLATMEEVAPGNENPSGIEWNIQRIRADQVWSRYSITGEGIVVANVDSGVDYLHPALVQQYRGNEGGGFFEHEYNWWDPSDLCDYPCNHESPVPHLSNGHGTKSMGIMVGDDGGTHQIGVAPGATWIAAFACCRETTLAEDVLSGIEWMLAPWQINDFDPSHPTADPSKRPHIVNGSLGLDPGSPILIPLMEAYLAAGIFPAFAAGTVPGECGTVATPADLPMVVGTGAIDSLDLIQSYSGRGPVAYPNWLKTYPRTGPDLVAPGAGLLSSVPGGGYGSFGGTSGATPHTAGAVALLWAAEPDLIGRVLETVEILGRSAFPLTTTETCGGDYPGRVPNNTYGWGRLDALAAVELVWQAGTLSGQVAEAGMGDPITGATIAASRGGYTLTTESGTDGIYELLLGEGSYTVTVQAYGHDPVLVTDIVISQDLTTTLSFTLSARQTHLLSGSISGGGVLIDSDPLEARLGIWATPISLTIPLAGDAYSATLAEGSYWMRVIADGFVHEDRTITITQDLVENIELEPTWTYYYRDSRSVCGPSYDWVDATSGTPHHQPYLSYFTINEPGLPFTFYGNTHTTYFVDTNGHISFGRGYPIPHQVIPFEGPPNNAIFGFGAVFNPLNGAQGLIYHQVLNDHKLVVEFHETQHWWTGPPETFEFVLDRETGAILLQYQEVQWPDFATVGVENPDGTDGVVYSFRNSGNLTDTLAVGFYPIFGPPPVAQEPDGVFGTIAGTVTISGTAHPVAGAVVTATTFLNTLTTTTDIVGHYQFSDICGEAYRVQAAVPGYSASPEVQVTMRQADDLIELDFSVAAGELGFEVYLPLAIKP